MPKAKDKKEIVYIRITNKKFLLKMCKKLGLTQSEYIQQLLDEQKKKK